MLYWIAVSFTFINHFQVLTIDYACFSEKIVLFRARRHIGMIFTGSLVIIGDASYTGSDQLIIIFVEG